MHTFKTVGIVIVDFHGFDQTITLLESLAKQKPPGEFKIYLVIADTTLQEATKQMQQFKSSVKLSNIAYLPIKNNGFSANNNTGIKEALRDGCDAVLMINNDTTVPTDFLSKLFKSANQYFEKHGLAIVCPKIYFSPGKEFHYESYTPEERGKVLWYGGGVVSWKYLSAWHAHVNEVDLGQADKISQTDFATFCASLIPRDVFKITGFLDEKYFLYFEDTDYSLRAQKKGIPTVYLPETHLWHDNAGSSGGSGSALQKYYQERNIVRFMLKHAPMRFKITTIRKLIQMLFSKDAVIREAGWDACLMRYHARKEKK